MSRLVAFYAHKDETTNTSDSKHCFVDIFPQLYSKLASWSVMGSVYLWRFNFQLVDPSLEKSDAYKLGHKKLGQISPFPLFVY